LVLGSATPTLESWNRACQKQDLLISLPHRVEDRPMPPVVVVDIRNDPQIAKGSAIGRALFQAMRTALGEEGQIILFLNLRGHSPVLWCRGCGSARKCPHCDITLTWHKDRNITLCHACDFQQPPPTHCAACGKAGLNFLGTGTQRLEAEVRARFPEASCLRMDSDAMKKPGSHDEALERFRQGDVRILLGTQMIAKGLDFPNVTLVGVISADTVLHQPDMRASERTFQLISQVAGRTGRSHRGGRVLVQTACPTEPAIQKAAMHDFLGFAEQELAHRRAMLAPPFYRFARVIVRGQKETAVRDWSLSIADKLRQAQASAEDVVHILGPAPAPVAKLQNHYRYHFQLAAETISAIQALWRKVLPELPQVPDVEYTIDVDPLNMR
jgi:primosomal protein N' (replication factor Y)